MKTWQLNMMEFPYFGVKLFFPGCKVVPYDAKSFKELRC